MRYIGGDKGEEDCEIEAGFPTLRRLGRWFALIDKILRCVCGVWVWCVCGGGAAVCQSNMHMKCVCNVCVMYFFLKKNVCVMCIV